jgi:acetolactate synthase-1/2/3 large subunit
MYSELISELRQAKKPVLLIGGGVQNYKQEFLELTKVLRIPAYATWNALDIVTSDLETYAGVVGTYGGPGRNFGIQASDFLLSIGSRISGRITGGTPSNFAPHAKRYFVDIDSGLLNPEWQPVKGRNILMDAGEFMSGLTRELGGEKLDFEPWLKRCKDWAVKYDPVKPEMLSSFHHYGFVRKLSERLPNDSIVVSDTGGNVIMMGHCFKSKWGQRLFTSNGNTAMGFAFCAALGAWFSEKRTVICLIGDGGFNMNLQEIQTMLNYGCNVKTFILNNHCYGNTKLYQKSNYGSRFLACGPDGYSPPNFEAVARGYNVPVVDRIDCYCNLEEKIDEVVKQPFPAIIDVVHHDFYDYYPRISRFDQELHDQDPPLPREEILENMT